MFTRLPPHRPGRGLRAGAPGSAPRGPREGDSRPRWRRWCVWARGSPSPHRAGLRGCSTRGFGQLHSPQGAHRPRASDPGASGGCSYSVAASSLREGPAPLSRGLRLGGACSPVSRMAECSFPWPTRPWVPAGVWRLSQLLSRSGHPLRPHAGPLSKPDSLSAWTLCPRPWALLGFHPRRGDPLPFPAQLPCSGKVSSQA